MFWSDINMYRSIIFVILGLIVLGIAVGITCGTLDIATHKEILFNQQLMYSYKIFEIDEYFGSLMKHCKGPYKSKHAKSIPSYLLELNVNFFGKGGRKNEDIRDACYLGLD